LLSKMSDELQLEITPFSYHLIELVERIQLICWWTLFAFVLFSIFPEIVRGVYIGEVESSSIPQSGPFSGRWIWAAFGSLMVLHCLFASQIYRYVVPALYASERRILTIIFLWVFMAPAVAFSAPNAQSWIGHLTKGALFISEMD